MSDFGGRGTPGEGAPLIIRIFQNNVYLLRGQFILKNLTLCVHRPPPRRLEGPGPGDGRAPPARGRHRGEGQARRDAAAQEYVGADLELGAQSHREWEKAKPI